MAVAENVYYKFALAFRDIPKHVEEFTFMEIARSSHRENLISNILKFYIDISNTHGLDGLLVDSLFEIKEIKNHIGKRKIQDDNSSEISAETELRTDGEGRIDLFVETDKYCIAIENKIYHSLANDLEDYKKKTLSICSIKQKKPILIVLSLFRLIKADDIAKLDKSGFINVTYSDWMTEIEHKIGAFIHKANGKYLSYFIDFIKSMKNLISGKMDNRELWKFIDENQATAKEISDAFIQYKNHQLRKVENLKDFIADKTSELGFFEEWIYNGWKDGFNNYSLVHEYDFGDDFKIAINTILRPKKWEIALHPRKVPLDFLMEKKVREKLTSFERREGANFLLKEIDRDGGFEALWKELRSVLIEINKWRVDNAKAQKSQ